MGRNSPLSPRNSAFLNQQQHPSTDLNQTNNNTGLSIRHSPSNQGKGGSTGTGAGTSSRKRVSFFMTRGSSHKRKHFTRLSLVILLVTFVITSCFFMLGLHFKQLLFLNFGEHFNDAHNFWNMIDIEDNLQDMGISKSIAFKSDGIVEDDKNSGDGSSSSTTVEKKRRVDKKKFHSARTIYDECRGIHWNEITITLPQTSIPSKKLRHGENTEIIGDGLQSRIKEIVSHVKLYTPLMESEDSSNPTVLVIPNALQPSHYNDYDRSKMMNQHENRKFDITMTTHMGVGKYTRFRILVQRWNGPVSVAVIIRSLEELDEFHTFVSNNVQSLNHVIFHYYMEFAPGLRMAYPQNRLRNLALTHIQTDYFMVNDVDILTSPLNTHDLLRDTITSHVEIHEKLNNDTFFALPMFDLHVMIPDDELIFNHPSFPETKSDAFKMNATGIISQHLATRHPRGHRAINYTKWFSILSSDDASSVSYAIQHENKFEPYVIGSKLVRHNGGKIPSFYPFYRGHGFDKYSWFAELEFAGFKLEVLRDFFTFHAKHESSYGDKNATKKLFATNTFCSRGFMKEIVKKYGKQDNELWDDWMKNVYKG
mmetsp:Transcript_5083/g.9651  ORF Transcript_5083/g.9651 Transcript_5083/m.9651 type:complete len:593 (+) Transcript_5083:222-2000(+)